MEIQTPWYRKTADDALKSLNSSEKGLMPEEVKARQEKFGPNELKEGRKKTALDIFISQFKSLVVLALLIAALLSLAMEEYLDVGVISFVLVLNALIGTYQEYRAEKALEALKKMAASSARIIRGGIQQKIFAREIVPGDIFLLETGDRVPSDGRILEAANLSINESMLTGESLPSLKENYIINKETQVSDRKNMVFRNTIVTSGRARAVAVATGMQSEIGKVAVMLQETEEVATPLQNRLSQFMKQLGKLVLIGAIFVVLAGTFIAHFEIQETVRLAVAQAVSFIPEGLPIVVTIVLAVGVGDMAAKNAIVRRLPAVETLGCVTTICTDKTGTLTKNEMTVKEIQVPGRKITLHGEGYGAIGEFKIDGSTIEPLRYPRIAQLIQAAVLCNDASIEKVEDKIQIFGDPTEGALLVMARKAGLTKAELDREYKRIGEVQFDPQKKFMATFNMVGNEIVAYAKGAPEKILDMCEYYLHDGKPAKLTQISKQKILASNKGMASQALRVLGFAYKKTEHANEKGLAKMVFIGLVGMHDPPREEAKDAVSACRQSGIRVVMITGDHKLTALGIANELGIADKKSLVLTGEELDRLNDAEFGKIVGKVAIYARTSSEHKMRIVEMLRKKGEVVAMTGDGVNDALAIKKADIGIAMGLSGTEVTKESSDMVLADDNFSTIVGAIEEGRGTYLNIKKVVAYLLSTNVGEIIFLIMVLLSSLYLPQALPLALLPIHILWINLVTDGVCDVTLAMEPKEKGLMKKKPRNPKEPLITRDMAVFIAVTAMVMAIGTFMVFYLCFNGENLNYARTMAFTTLACFQLFSAINARSEKSIFEIGFFTNPYLLGAILLSLLMQFGAVYAPFLNEAMKTVPLSLNDWAAILVATSSLFIVIEFKKFWEKSISGKAIA